MTSPLKENRSYYVPPRCLTSEKKHRKIMSTTITSSEIPKCEINNNFESHKNLTQNFFYDHEYYHSRSTLLNATQKKFHINNQFLQVCNRINLLKKKKESSQQRREVKSYSIKEYLERQRMKMEYLQAKKQVLFFKIYLT